MSADAYCLIYNYLCMKKIFFALTAMFAGIFTLTGCESDGKINESKLPDAAKSFIADYFGDKTVTRAEKDRDNGAVTYEVILSDGTEIDFDKDGVWTSVDCKFAVVPAGIIPEVIAKDLSVRYPGTSVYKIDKEYGGYELSVTGSKELIYDASGKFVREDTDR